MRQSKNKPLGKNKYYNIQKGKKENGLFFLLPSIVISPKKMSHWHISMSSIFFGIGKYYLQYNIFETVKDINTQVRKEDMVNLLQVLKTENFGFTQDENSVKRALLFLSQNPSLVTLLKNANLKHDYNKKIIIDFVKDSDFVMKK